MDIKVTLKQVNDMVTKSNLPVSDYVINPYVGCTHACKYCYACFMKRFTGHTEPWGTFIDVKLCDKPLNVKALTGKRVVLSSVTDCYNEYEKEFKITRGVLEKLAEIDCEVWVSTKSDLILRDLDILKKFKHLKVSMSINTLDENFKNDMDNAVSIERRLAALKVLHENGIFAVLFMSPIFPYITDFKAIIQASKQYIDEYWFENLNLRGEYKAKILDYIAEKYPQYKNEYDRIYKNKEMAYWQCLAAEIDEYCCNNNIKYINYFYHEKLVAEKKASGKNK